MSLRRIAFAPVLRRRRRDRRGRGLRGPLGPAGLPVIRTRAERFDDLVLDAVERLEQRWRDELREVELAVEEVPPVPAVSPLPLGSTTPVPLGRAVARSGPQPPRLVVYRRPVESRAEDARELAELVHDVVVEQLAELLGVAPETVDPDYGEPDEPD